jgi:hypothetical protein
LQYVILNPGFRDIRLIGNLSNRSNYRYESAEVDKIFKVLEREMKQARARFESESDEDQIEFTLWGCMSAVWNFEPLSPNAEEHGISEWDQFDKEELGIDPTLLREATQNSLDARDASKAQTPGWESSGSGGWILPAWLEELLAPLKSHLDAAGRTLETADHAALVLEDFGTSGLTGRTIPAIPGTPRLLLSPFELSQGRRGRAVATGQVSIRPHVRLVVLVRPDSPDRWQNLADG